MQKIVITGPESSGKTTLAKELAIEFDAPWVPEYARSYLEGLPRQYIAGDLLEIARGQWRQEQQFAGIEGRFLFLDTDLLTIKIWSDYRFGHCASWIIDRIKEQDAFYLLCMPNIPWVFDPLRENPADRHLLFDIYQEELRTFEKPYQIIQELNQDERLKEASRFILELMDKKNPGV